MMNLFCCKKDLYVHGMLIWIVVTMGVIPACEPAVQPRHEAGVQQDGRVTEDTNAEWRQVPERLFNGARPFIETGIPGNAQQAWFGDDGSFQTRDGPGTVSCWIFDLETGEAAFSWTAGGRVSLAEGYLPIPRIRWTGPGDVEIEAELMSLLKGDTPPQGEEETFHRMQVRLFNIGSETRSVRLMVGVSPFGLNGSAARPSTYRFSDSAVYADSRPWIRFSQRPVFVGACARDRSGAEVPMVWQETVFGQDEESSSLQPGSLAVFAFDFDLQPAQSDFSHAAPQAKIELLVAAVPGSPFPEPDDVVMRKINTRLYWQNRSGLDRPGFQVPHRAFCDAFRGAASSLMLAPPDAGFEGLALGAVALARAGQFEAARGLLDSLIARLDGAGAYHQGLALYALADHYNFTGDQAWAEKAYEATAPLSARLAGLLEGAGQEEAGHAAADQPYNRFDSYKELCWVLHGLENAAILASATGRPDEATRFTELRGTHKDLLINYLQKNIVEDGLKFIPHAPAVSTPSAHPSDQAAFFWPTPILDPLSHWVQRSFQHYWEAWKAAPGTTLDSCQLPVSLVMLGRSEDAVEVLEWLLDRQRIACTFRWGEDFYDKNGLSVAAAYMISFRMLFIIEEGGRLILAPGLPRSWSEFQETAGIRSAPTPFGAVTYSLFTHEGVSELSLDGGARPPNGFALTPVFDTLKPQVEIDGRKLRSTMNTMRRKLISFPPGTLSVRVTW